MALQDWPTTKQIGTIFEDEIAGAGGRVVDRYEDGTRLLARSVLPDLREVGLGDRVQGGVAIRAIDREIQVHPYLFRQVCRNGAIRAQTIQTWRVTREDDAGPVVDGLRVAIRGCCSEEAFADSVDQMRSAREVEADAVLMLIPMIARLPQRLAVQLLTTIMGRFTEEGDPSGFGFMNAVTSVARDTRDPELRWRLEELGGGVPLALMSPNPTLDPARAELVLA